MFNAIPSDGAYSKLTLDINDFDKDIKNIRYGKPRKALFIPADSIPMQLRNAADGSIVFNNTFFTNPIEANTDYIYVATMNDAQQLTLMSAQYPRYLIVPGMEYDCGMVFANSMAGDDLKLVVNSQVTDNPFEFGDFKYGVYGTGAPYVIEVRRADNDALVNSHSFQPKKGFLYIFVFGGTTDESDAYPPVLTIHKSKKPKN
jgi:hypothetical protein